MNNTSMQPRPLKNGELKALYEQAVARSKYTYRIKEENNKGVYRIARRHKWFPYYRTYGRVPGFKLNYFLFPYETDKFRSLNACYIHIFNEINNDQIEDDIFKTCR